MADQDIPARRSEALRKRPVLVERCTFRPVTKLTIDLLDRALEQFLEAPGVREGREALARWAVLLGQVIPP